MFCSVEKIFNTVRFTKSPPRYMVSLIFLLMLSYA